MKGTSPFKLVAALSRRGFFGRAAAASGAVLLGSRIPSKVWADDGADDEGSPRLCDFPVPIPHIDMARGIHFYFPGPVSGAATGPDPCLGAPIDPAGAHPEGRDPSVIFNFKGFIGQADLCLTGTGIDLHTGMKAAYQFHTDMRFMHGVFVGTDLVERKASFAFV